MTKIYRFGPNEISLGFLESLMEAYKDTNLEITIFDATVKDETHCLNNHPAVDNELKSWWPKEEDILEDIPH
jgi:hypothetical protein